jgi:hypothetical protein
LHPQKRGHAMNGHELCAAALEIDVRDERTGR